MKWFIGLSPLNTAFIFNKYLFDKHGINANLFVFLNVLIIAIDNFSLMKIENSRNANKLLPLN